MMPPAFDPVDALASIQSTVSDWHSAAERWRMEATNLRAQAQEKEDQAAAIDIEVGRLQQILVVSQGI